MQDFFVTEKPISQKAGYIALMHAGGRPAKKPRTDLGNRIAQAREQAGLSQGQLAEKMDVSQQVIAAWERKAKTIRTNTLIKLAGILGVSADELLGMKTPRQKAPAGRTRQVFDSVSSLPRRQQQKIVEVVQALVAQQSNRTDKAS